MPNDIALRTNKGEYVGGDTVYGSVYLCIRERVPTKSLRLVIRGYEISEYQYSYLEQLVEGDEDSVAAKTGKRTFKKDIIKAEIKLIDLPGQFHEGCFAYAFQYQLPHNLPGVFHTQSEGLSEKSWEGVIKYSLGAMLEMPEGTAGQRLSVESPMVIYDSLDCRNTHMASDVHRATGTVKTFFCIQRGNVQVSSRLDHSAYCPTDKIIVNLELQNDSAVDVTGCTVKLIRVIKLYGLDRSRGEEDLSTHTLYDTVLEVPHDGCNKNSRRSCQVVLDLSQYSEGIGFPPTTSGTIVKSSYVVDVDVHVPWAPDIEVRQPLIIKPPSNSVWENWSPPDWVCECVQAVVSGVCAVPPDILSSQSFTGIPGFQPLL